MLGYEFFRFSSQKYFRRSVSRDVSTNPNENFGNYEILEARINRWNFSFLCRREHSDVCKFKQIFGCFATAQNKKLFFFLFSFGTGRLALSAVESISNTAVTLTGKNKNKACRPEWWKIITAREVSTWRSGERNCRSETSQGRFEIIPVWWCSTYFLQATAARHRRKSALTDNLSKFSNKMAFLTFRFISIVYNFLSIRLCLRLFIVAFSEWLRTMIRRFNQLKLFCAGAKKSGKGPPTKRSNNRSHNFKTIGESFSLLSLSVQFSSWFLSFRSKSIESGSLRVSTMKSFMLNQRHSNNSATENCQPTNSFVKITWQLLSSVDGKYDHDEMTLRKSLVYWQQQVGTKSNLPVFCWLDGSRVSWLVNEALKIRQECSTNGVDLAGSSNSAVKALFW